LLLVCFSSLQEFNPDIDELHTNLTQVSKMYLKLFLNRKVRSVLFKIVIGIVIIYGGFNLYKSAPELNDLKVSTLNWDPKFTFIAFSVTLIYIICQSFIYYFLIKNFGNHISFKKCTEIFLKRNFLSFFLPAGNISSLTFIPDSIKKNKIKTAALYHASIWYGIISLFTFFLVAIPVFILIYKYQFFRSHIWLSTVFICAQLLIFIYLIYSVYKRNRLYQTIVNLSPLLNDIFSGSIRKISFKKSFWLSFIASLFVEFCGIAHINIALILITNQSSIEVSAIVYVLTVITGMISPFMKGAGLAEVAVFMFLKIIGYDVTTSILITSAFRFFEFWLPLLIGSFLFIWRLIKVAGKILPAVLLFISGVINVISAVTPPLHNRLNFLISFVPKIVSDFSTYATLLIGFILILISFYLYKGIKNAWLITIMILSESILTNMLKAIDYEEAIISLIVLVILLITPRHYWIKSYKKQSKQILIGALWGIFALLIFGFLGLYFMDVKYFNADLTYEQAISITINSVFYLNNSNIYPASLFGKFFVYFLHFTSFLFWIILLF
jgi:phosphatidylglycerol lysyltransferase